PSPSSSPTESPSASASPDQTPTTFAVSPARITTNLSGFDVISRPPFVFLPIFGFGALLLSLAYWAFSVLRRPRRLAPLPSAALVHRATRPDYTAAFGTAPSRPADTPATSAWNEAMPPPGTPTTPTGMQPPLPTPAAPAPAVEEPQPPAVEWGLGAPDSGYPTPPPVNRRPEDDWPEMPQPGD